MDYPKILKEILKSSHWTQEQLAAKLGVSFATVNSWINGRTTPQKSLAPEIKKMYLAQDATNEPEPIYITIVNAEKLVVGDYVILEKERMSNHDDEAIEVYLEDMDDKNEGDGEGSSVGFVESCDDVICHQMYVANSVNTVARGTRSAGRIYDKFDVMARAQVMFVYRNMAIARIVSWHVKCRLD